MVLEENVGKSFWREGETDLLENLGLKCWVVWKALLTFEMINLKPTRLEVFCVCSLPQDRLFAVGTRRQQTVWGSSKVWVLGNYYIEEVEGCSKLLPLPVEFNLDERSEIGKELMESRRSGSCS